MGPFYIERQNFHWQYLSSLIHEIELTLNVQENIITTLEKSSTEFRAGTKQIENKFENSEKFTVDEEDRDRYYSFYVEQFRDFANKFTDNQRFTSVVSIYSMIESILLQICQRLEKLDLRLNESESINKRLENINMSKQGIERYYFFLKKSYEIDTQNLSNLYNRICDWKFIRNQIVHKGGCVKNSEDDKQNKKDADKVSKIKGLKVYNDYIEVKSREPLDNLLELSKDFFEVLLKVLDERVKLLYANIPWWLS